MANRAGHILVVDDNRLNRMPLARSLRQEGHTWAMAENDRQVLEVMKGDSAYGKGQVASHYPYR